MDHRVKPGDDVEKIHAASAVIASAAKQSSLPLLGDNGLLRWARNDVDAFRLNLKQQIHVRLLAAGLARGLNIVSPSNEGAGNAGCALHPRSRVQSCTSKKTHTSIQGSGEHPTFPAQWLDGLSRAHPGEFMAFVASVAPRKPARQPGRACSTSARLDAYQFQASGPHAFA
ncbi:MAG: hypothetical protein ABIL01_07745, partial [Pseudomonadota bacterium]